MISLPLLKIMIGGGLFIGLMGLERLFPASPRPRGDDMPRTFRNLSLGVISALFGPILLVPLTVFLTGHHFWQRPDFMTGAIGLILDFILIDLWAYALHRAYHEIPLLWRLHSVHHYDAFLDASSAVRFHFGEVLLSTALRAIPILLLSLPLSSVLFYETALIASALFHHSNIALPEKFEKYLRFIIVTPSHHWVHHHAARRDTDSNYSAGLTVWDRLFKSLSPTQRTPEMKIGIENTAERKLIPLLLTPFISPEGQSHEQKLS
jgi:sterol desaturase/sphingolipid hydroxylase (fatty acid hydroxylase superfamily)